MSSRRLMPWLRAAFSVAPVIAARAHAQASAQAPVTAFVDVAVVPMDRERVIAHQTVVVQGDRIIALGPARKVPIPAGATRIDGRGKFLIPGLGDMHVHTLRSTLGADTSEVNALLFAYVASGVTAIREMHAGGRSPRPKGPSVNSDTDFLRLRGQLARGEVLGPHVYTAGDPDVSSPEAAARSVAELKADGHDFVKISFEGKEQRLPAVQAVYDSIIAAARRAGIRVVGHVPPGLDVLQLGAPWASTEHLHEFIEYALGLGGRWSRTDGVALGYSLLPSTIVDTAFWMRPGYRLDSGKLRRLAAVLRRNEIWTCPTLSLEFSFLEESPAEVERTKRFAGSFGGNQTFKFVPFHEFSFQIVRTLQDAGAGLLAGSDSYDSPFAVHRELAMLVRAGLTPYQALAAGTRNVAQFLGTLDSSGTVAVGKRADLVLLFGNPMRDIGYTAGPAGVMVGGRWLSRADLDARLTAMDSLRSSARPQFYQNLKESREQVWRH